MPDNGTFFQITEHRAQVFCLSLKLFLPALIIIAVSSFSRDDAISGPYLEERSDRVLLLDSIYILLELLSSPNYNPIKKRARSPLPWFVMHSPH